MSANFRRSRLVNTEFITILGTLPLVIENSL